MSQASPRQLLVQAVRDQLSAIIEAILFTAPEPVPLKRLCEVTGADAASVQAALEGIACHLRRQEHGFELVEVAGGYRLVTKKEFSHYIEALLQPQKSFLSPSALETLAIVAYRQPVTRAEIEAIRGVNCERSIRTLLERGLIKETGRKDAPGRPLLYGTTDEFLEHFGLRDLSQLPPPPDELKKQA